MTTVQAKIDRFRAAVSLVCSLEGMTDEEAEADDHAQQLDRVEAEVEGDLTFRLSSLKGEFGARQAVQQANAPAPAPAPAAAPGAAGHGTQKVQAKSPPMLDKDVTFTQFVKWKKAWDNFAKLAQLAGQPREIQVAHFRSCCTPDLRDKMVHAMAITDDATDTLAQVIEKFQTYLKEQRNIAIDRQLLVKSRQKEHETFDDFYTRLCVRAEDAAL